MRKIKDKIEMINSCTIVKLPSEPAILFETNVSSRITIQITYYKIVCS